MEKMEVISPVGGTVVGKQNIAPRLPTLEGKTVGETWNGDFKGDFMFPIYREFLQERYPGVKIIPYAEFPSSPLSGSPAYQREIAQRMGLTGT